jgi:hypothetical protein
MISEVETLALASLMTYFFSSNYYESCTEIDVIVEKNFELILKCFDGTICDNLKNIRIYNLTEYEMRIN